MSRPAAPHWLLVDAGNTRIKWASWRRGRLGPMRDLAWHPDAGARVERSVRALRALERGPVTRIILVSVLGGTARKALVLALAERFGAPVTLIRSEASAAGVRCGYREPWRLGVDRWAAIVGAHHHFDPPRDCCVVDIGTAMTLDFVDRRGRHHGGAIVPGPTLMVSSLLRETDGIRARANTRSGTQRGLYARATRDAIEQGAHHAAAALIERALSEARRLHGARPRLLLTGGGARALVPYLSSPPEVVPDLVLRGALALAVLP